MEFLVDTLSKKLQRDPADKHRLQLQLHVFPHPFSSPLTCLHGLTPRYTVQTKSWNSESGILESFSFNSHEGLSYLPLPLTAIIYSQSPIFDLLGGRGDSYMKRSGMLVGIELVKDTNLYRGMAQALLTPKRYHCFMPDWFGLPRQHDGISFFHVQPLMSPRLPKKMAFCPEHPNRDQNP